MLALNIYLLILGGASPLLYESLLLKAYSTLVTPLVRGGGMREDGRREGSFTSSPLCTTG